MSYYLPFTTCVSPLPIENSCEDAQTPPTNNSLPSPIYTLNNDTLLNIFYLYQLHIPGEEGEEDPDASGIRKCRWDRQRWWYELIQVCRWWRFIILGSPSKLDLHLLCTHGVSVADMLKHSPCPGLPLTIFYDDAICKLRRKGLEGPLLAISRHRDRVRHISLRLPPQRLQKLLSAMDEEFPILEHLNLETPTRYHYVKLLPETFLAPNLRHIHLLGVALPTQSPLWALPTTTRSLTFLWLGGVPRSASAYFPTNHMRAWLSFIPLLETLVLDFSEFHEFDDVGDMAISTQVPVTLENLRLFYFRGVTAHLECLLSHIIAPVLSTFRVQLYDHFTLVMPQTCQFIQSSESLQFNAFDLAFIQDFFEFRAEPHRALWECPFYLRIGMNSSSDEQIVSTMHILRALTRILSVVEQLTLYEMRTRNLVYFDRTQWHELLALFSNVKVVSVGSGAHFIQTFFGSLCSVDGESPPELLPNLEELTHSYGTFGDAYKSFLDERQTAGRPVRVKMCHLYR